MYVKLETNDMANKIDLTNRYVDRTNGNVNPTIAL